MVRVFVFDVCECRGRVGVASAWETAASAGGRRYQLIYTTQTPRERIEIDAMVVLFAIV